MPPRRLKLSGVFGEKMHALLCWPHFCNYSFSDVCKKCCPVTKKKEATTILNHYVPHFQVCFIFSAASHSLAHPKAKPHNSQRESKRCFFFSFLSSIFLWQHMATEGKKKSKLGQHNFPNSVIEIEKLFGGNLKIYGGAA